jgi:hypothetical protein
MEKEKIMNFIRSAFVLLFLLLVSGCTAAEHEPTGSPIPTKTTTPTNTQRPTDTPKRTTPTPEGFTQSEKDYYSFAIPLFRDYKNMVLTLNKYNNELSEDSMVISDSEWVAKVKLLLLDMTDYSLEMAAYPIPPALFEGINQGFKSIHIETRELEKDYARSIENSDPFLLNEAIDNYRAINVNIFQITNELLRIEDIKF